MTLEELRNELLWSRADLARHAGLNYETVMRAEAGEWVTTRTAAALVKALSEALGRVVHASEINGLRIKGVTKERG